MVSGLEGMSEGILTDEQRQIVEAPLHAKILVTAGPGTGKTRVLVERLSHLIEKFELSPGHEVLVLSFSRAAVSEIARRAKDSSGPVGFVRALTFDSFATRLLAATSHEETWVSRDYEGRILAAIDCLRTNDDARALIEGYEHIIVDEIQDLVGARAGLVKIILESAKGGFTLLGDPAQGIYNYQLEGHERQRGSAELYDWIRREFHHELLNKKLTMNHRTSTDQARLALWAGTELNTPEPDYQDIKYRLDTDILSLPSLGSLETAAQFLLRGSTRTAILCRNNGTALIVSRELWKFGVNHSLNNRAVDRFLPAWIAIVARRLEFSSVGRSKFMRVTEDITDLLPPAPLAWSLLKKMDRGPGDTLNLALVANKIRTGNVPDDICYTDDCGKLIVSSIHRAKGLEFDRVVLSETRDARESSSVELAEETRIQYVALTRARREIYHVEYPRLWGLFKHSVDRWCRRVKRGMTTDFEIRPDDAHADEPAGAYILEGNVAAIQDYLTEKVKPGDVVSLRRLCETQTGEPRAYYCIEHQGFSIGVTGDRFSFLLYSVLKTSKTWKVTWPVAIEGVRVEGVDTVAGNPSAGRTRGLGETGLWLRVRMVGLGSLRFPKKGAST